MSKDLDKNIVEKQNLALCVYIISAEKFVGGATNKKSHKFFRSYKPYFSSYSAFVILKMIDSNQFRLLSIRKHIVKAKTSNNKCYLNSVP